MTTDTLSATFAALADPTRRAMLGRLATGEATVNELAEPFDMSLQAVSKHVKVLEHAGLISRRQDAQRRPCILQLRPLDDAVDWLEQHRQVLEGRLDRLEEHLRSLQGQQRQPTTPHPPTPTPRSKGRKP